MQIFDCPIEKIIGLAVMSSILIGFARIAEYTMCSDIEDPNDPRIPERLSLKWMNPFHKN